MTAAALRAAALGLAVVVVPCLAQNTARRPAGGSLVKRTYASPVDGAAIDYALWVPDVYDAKRSWPLIVFLHGSAEGKNWTAPTAPEASVPVRGAMADLPYLVVFPLMRGSVTISGMAEKDVLDTIADVRAHYNVDADGVHLTGLSFGGFAAWKIACHYPHLFASLSVFCGGGQPELAVNLRHVPTQVWHGAADTSVSIAHSLDMVEAMRRAKLSPTFHEMRGKGHVCWREEYASRSLYQWMAKQSRVRAPSRISYRTFGLRHAQAYWATILQMADPSKPAYVDAFAPGGDKVLLHTENVSRLLLKPPSELLSPSAKPAFVLDGETWSAAETTDGWVVTLPGAAEGPLAKRPGLSGPIQDVYWDSFAVVLPGGGAADSNAEWLKTARSVFAWTNELVYHGSQYLEDADVSLERATRSHLICFGDAENNRILAQAKERLPMIWTDGRVRTGDRDIDGIAALVMIYPNPLVRDRYLVVCSGRPQAVAQAAGAALRPAMLGPPPVEDIILMTDSGGLLVPEKPHTQPTRPARMNAPAPPRGFLFDNAWQLRAQIGDSTR